VHPVFRDKEGRELFVRRKPTFLKKVRLFAGEILSPEYIASKERHKTKLFSTHAG
jgi:hypothetical protein